MYEQTLFKFPLRLYRHPNIRKEAVNNFNQCPLKEGHLAIDIQFT